MMPMAGQDAVLNAATIERKPHMRTAVVECEHLSALVHEQHRAVAAVHNKSPFGFYVFEATRAHKIRGRVVHRRLTRGSSAAAPLSRGLTQMSIERRRLAPRWAAVRRVA